MIFANVCAKIVANISISTGDGYQICFAQKSLQPSDQVYFAETATCYFLMSQGPIHTA
jgi:hypothetical protein